MNKLIIYQFFNKKYVLSGLLIVLVFLIHHQTLYNDFTNWDDPMQITENEDIKEINIQNVTKIFSSYYAAMYQPNTTLMYAVEYQLTGSEPFLFHLTSLILHIFNTLLIFLIFRFFFRYRWQAFLIALLFGVHPVQVEAVSWLSARSTLICFFFMFISVILYLKYYQQDSRKVYLLILSVFSFLLSLLSKSTSIFLPLLLIIFDYFLSGKMSWKMLPNKIPYFVLSVLFGIITIFSRAEPEFISKITTYYSFFDRIFIVSYSILLYLKNIFIPIDLSAYYAFPVKESGILPWYYYAALPSLLILITAAIVHYRNKGLILGISLFFLPILPVLQVLPTLKFIAADRYIYFSLTGIFFLLIWFFPVLQNKWSKISMCVITTVYILFLGYQSHHQTIIWENSETLWSDVISKNDKIADAWKLRAEYYKRNDRIHKALNDINKLLSLNPKEEQAFIDRSVIKGKLEDYEGSIKDCDAAIKLNDSLARAFSNRAYAYLKLKNFEQASFNANRALELDSTLAVAYFVKGRAIGTRERLKEAIGYFNKAIEYSPGYGAAYYIRGLAKIHLKDTLNGCEDLHKAAKLDFTMAEKYISRFCVGK